MLAGHSYSMQAIKSGAGNKRIENIPHTHNENIVPSYWNIYSLALSLKHIGKFEKRTTITRRTFGENDDRPSGPLSNLFKRFDNRGVGIWRDTPCEHDHA